MLISYFGKDSFYVFFPILHSNSQNASSDSRLSDCETTGQEWGKHPTTHAGTTAIGKENKNVILPQPPKGMQSHRARRINAHH